MRTSGKNLQIIVNNFVISYTDEGPAETPVIIFIHGFPFNKSMWDVQVEALKENYRVIAYDVRGHGDSDPGIGGFSISLFANDLIALMDTLAIDTAILCGLSMGGYIALNAVENYPDRFQALVLSDTQCTKDTPDAREKRLKTIENIRENGVAVFFDESIKKFFAHKSFVARQKEIAEVMEMMMKTSKESIGNTLFALAGRKETCSKLASIKVPVLILVGEEDTITPPAAAWSMHEKIRDSALVIVPHAAHLPNMENPAVFNERLKTFIRQFVKVISLNRATGWIPRLVNRI